jgi:zinc protease
MIKFNRFILDNGLRVLVHEDRSTPLVAMNLLYDVGSRDEDPEMTGLAHLFEHLMFGGTENIPDFDRPLQMAGGENNAFTNNDITNYYITLPSQNIETAFWLESDRMLGLNLSTKNLETQKNVVIEEFNQRYLNQPYGDAIIKIRPLAYLVHPYRWPTIGMDKSHIDQVNAEHASSFFYSHYAPNNAILTLAGNVTAESAFNLAEKWFGPIPKRKVNPRNIPAEPVQQEKRFLSVVRDVPADALYKVWHIDKRNSDDFHTLDLVTDLLAGGESGRLYTKLVREKKLFSDINAYISSDLDPGLIFIHGKLMKGTGIEVADKAVIEVLDGLKDNNNLEYEMEKVKNKFESSTVFSNSNILNKAMNLSFFELIDDADQINDEVSRYRNVTPGMVKESCEKYFNESNCSTLYYLSSRSDHK